MAHGNPGSDEIIAMADPVLRNLWITQRYHELALSLQAKGLGTDATWCAFAVWASKTAGTTIRGQELPARVQELLEAGADPTSGDGQHRAVHRFNHGLDTWLAKRLDHTLLMRLVQQVSQNVSAALAAGNVLVFSELAPLFTIVVDADSTEAAAPLVADTLARLAATGVDTTAVTNAFDAYAAALATHDDDVRATSVLAANVLAVSHEQTRLQTAIASALDAAVHDMVTDTVRRHIGRHVPTTEGRRLFDRLSADVADAVEGVWQTALTEAMLRLVTSDETFVLHENVPPLPDAAGELFPAALDDLVGTAAAAPFDTWDRTDGTGRPTGAYDWAEIRERMNYIATLFRSRQRHPALFTPPFSAAQLATLAEGSLPDGPL